MPPLRTASRMYKSQSSRRSSSVAKGLSRVSAAQVDKNLAKQVTKLTKITRGLSPELKFADITLTSNDISVTNGVAVLMNQVAQGITLANRIGNFITLRSIYIAGYIKTTTTSFDLLDDYYWRCMVVLDKDAGIAASATVGTLVVDSPTVPVHMLYNNLYLKRFKIMYDSGPMLISTIQNTLGCEAPRQLMIRETVPVPASGVKLMYDGAGASDIAKTALYFILFTNADVAGADSLDFVGSSRIRFTDV